MSVLGPDSPLFKNDPNKHGQWLVHHPYATPLAYLVIGSLQLIIKDEGGWFDALSITLSIGFLVLVTFSFFGFIQHLRGFCQTCFHQPAGGPEVAKKHIGKLRMHHIRGSLNKWVLIGILLVILLPNFFLSGWPLFLYGVFYFMVLAYSDKASQTHDWLVPWCPWCKDDGRWTEVSPAPDPSMTKQSS